MATFVYLIRHALAEERDEYKARTQKSDFYRPLTERGRKKFTRVLKKLKTKNAEIKKVYYSPFVRCQQTAELLGAALQVKCRALSSLGHGENQKKILRKLSHEKTSCAYVGHEPELSTLLQSLKVGGVELGKKFKKGEVLCLEKKKNSYTARWNIVASKKT